MSHFDIPDGMKITGAIGDRFDEILSRPALEFVADLQQTFGVERERLLEQRLVRQVELDREPNLDFLDATRNVRESDWKIASLPDDLLDRRVEITGPPARKMVINTVSFDPAHAYRDQGMTAYARLQEREFELEATHGYRAIKHQSSVGAGYFDDVTQVITSGETATTALAGSTEVEQFDERTPDYSEVEAHHVDGGELESIGAPEKILG